MKCKLDHNDAEELPKFLCRVCTPQKPSTAKLTCEEWPAESEAVDWTEVFAKRKLRKLRKEERRLSDLIDEIGNRDPGASKRLFAAIKVVEGEIEALRKQHGFG